MAVRLSKRLQALADLVPEGSVLADVGTDHGYLPIYLCQEGKVPSAIAMDVRKGPLERATEHITQFQLEDRIETRLSDGLEKLTPGEVETILIAGMGGILMQRILEDGKAVAKAATTMILQPQSDLTEFRYYLAKMGYEIREEDMILEDGKYYPMMKVVQGEAYKLSELQAAFGPLLLEKKHPVLMAWMEKEYKLNQSILERLNKAEETEEILTRKEIIRHRIKLLDEGMAYQT